MFCTDPLLGALKQYGYNVVRLPRADIRPLQILARRKTDLETYGSLATTLDPAATGVPTIAENVAVANIAGKQVRTGAIGAKLGVSMLGGVVSAMGGSPVGMDASYEQASTVEFEFQDVTEDSIEIAALDLYLSAAKVNPNARAVAQLLENDAICVITRTLKARTLKVDAKDSSNRALALDADKIQNIVGAKVKVSGGSDSTSGVTFQGNTPLVFAFQAVQLVYRDGQFVKFDPLAPGAAAMRGAEEGVRSPAAIDRDGHRLLVFTPDGVPFVRLRDAADAGAFAETSRARRALLIGIDRYPNLEARYQLTGCGNDVAAFREALVQTYGFPPENVRTLREEEATRDAILDALDRLVHETGTDDIVVIQYSGHGSQVIDREGDEADMRDETIVAQDSGRVDKPNRDITDDELYARLLALAQATSNVTLVFDCCHSGTITRDAFTAPSRSVDADLRPGEQLPPASIPAGFGPTMQATRGATPKKNGLVPIGGSYVLIAGCSDEETSFEYPVAATDDHVRHGALTFFLLQELAAAAPGATYRDVFERAAPRVTAVYKGQHPQLEGNVDRELFGIVDRKPMPYVRVEGSDGAAVTLHVGAAHGITVGSIFGIYPPGTRSAAPAARLARVRVDRVGGVSSTATLLDAGAPGPIPADARAFLEERAFTDLRLAVEVDDRTGGSTAASENMRALIQDQKALKLVTENGDVRLYALPADDARARGGAMPDLGTLPEPTWAAAGADGLASLFPPGAIRDAATVNRVVDNLRIIAAHRAALAIDNPDPADPLRGQVSLKLLRKDAGGRWVEAAPDSQGAVVFHDGNDLALRLTNRYSARVFPCVLDFGLTGRIEQVFPPAGSQPALEPGSYDFGVRPGEDMTVSFPDGFGGSEGVESLKLFAATTPIDFRWLEQQGTRAALSGLEELMHAILGGKLDATREVSRKTLPVGEPWTTAIQSFVLRR
jgi:hypothetical protein